MLTQRMLVVCRRRFLYILSTITPVSLLVEVVLLFLVLNELRVTVSGMVNYNIPTARFIIVKNAILCMYYWLLMSVEANRRFHCWLAHFCSKRLLNQRIFSRISFKLCYLFFIGGVLLDLFAILYVFRFRKYGPFTFESTFIIFLQGKELGVILCCANITAWRLIHFLSRRYSLVGKGLGFGLISAEIILLAVIFGRFMGTVTIAHLHRGMLGNRPTNCEIIGKGYKPEMSRTWLIPAIIPPRLYTFLFDREECLSKSSHVLGYVDREENVLVIPAKCRDGKQPRVLVGMVPLGIYELSRASMKWETHLLDRIARLNDDVIIHRDGNGNITKAELNGRSLFPEKRAPRNSEERAARQKWSSASDDVLVVRLGNYNQYVVDCGGDDVELFIHPLKERTAWEKASVECNTEEAPHANVIVFFFDALSRYSASRRLPKFTSWLRDFHARNRTGHVVQEFTLTSSAAATVGNWPLMTVGASRTYMYRHNFSNMAERISLVEDHHIVHKSKKKYGQSLWTTVAIDLCADDYISDIYECLPPVGPGLMGRRGGIDQSVYEPFCLGTTNLASTGSHCYFGMNAHKMYLEYLESVVYASLHPSDPGPDTPTASSCPAQSSFFHWFMFLDSHEPTERSLEIVDEDLARFMVKLDTEMHFFDDPRNTIAIIGDHGPHFGYFASTTSLGLVENGSPPLVFIVHPDTMKQVDRTKLQPDGTSMINFMKRAAKDLTTHFDFYLTLCDLMQLDCVTHATEDLVVKPASVFTEIVSRENISCFDFLGADAHPHCGLFECI